jgi:hypothetical protein
MKIKIIVIILILAILLSLIPIYVKSVPCVSFYGSGTGVIDAGPHNTFCKIDYTQYTMNKYFYFIENPYLANAIMFIAILIILSLIYLIIIKVKK